MKKLICLCVVIASLGFAAPLLAQTRGMTSEDYFAFETLGDPHFSPDGSTIAFVVTTVDQKQNRRRSAIWSVPSDGSREPVARPGLERLEDQEIQRALEQFDAGRHGGSI